MLQLDELPRLLAVPVVNVLLDLILGEAVTLLDLSFELIAAAVDHSEVIVGEFAPLLLDLVGQWIGTVLKETGSRSQVRIVNFRGEYKRVVVALQR